jgi:hypothetical protein
MIPYKSFYSDIGAKKDVTEDYPQSWNKEEFEKIRSFSGKLRYAKARLETISSGSGRSVFKIDNEKALKLAKNKKGLAQNKVESEKYLQNYDIVARTFDSGDEIRDDGPFWVEMELAKPLWETQFRRLTGVDIDDLEKYLWYVVDLHNGGKSHVPINDIKEEMENNEFVSELVRLDLDYDMAIGDQGRLSTYGEVVRDGKPKVVLVDFGLTKYVWNDYYKVKQPATRQHQYA